MWEVGGYFTEAPDEIALALLAKAHGAKAAQLNGPKFWAMDAQTLGLGDSADFGGIAARYAATLPYWKGRAQQAIGMAHDARQSFMTFIAARPEGDALAEDARERMR